MRDPRVREEPYLGFVARLPCIVCLTRSGIVNRAVQVAHIRLSDAAAGWRGAGMQEKPHDRLTVPICQPHHTGDLRKARMSQHAHGDELDFWENEMRIDIFRLVADLNDAYDAGQPGFAVIARHAGLARARRHA